MVVPKNSRTFVPVNNSVTVECLVVRRSCLTGLFMTKIARNVLITLAIMMACSINASAGTKNNERSFDWTPVISAIIQVESQGNPKAVVVSRAASCRLHLSALRNAIASCR